MGRRAISLGIAGALMATAVVVGAGTDLRIHRLHVPPPPVLDASISQPGTPVPTDPSTNPPTAPPPPGAQPPPPAAPPPPSGVGCTDTAGGTPADATGTLVEYTLTLAPASTFAAAPTLRFRGVNMGAFAHAIAIKAAGTGALKICGTPIINPGQSDTFAVTNLPAGNYVIYCTIHSASMHQAVTVN